MRQTVFVVTQTRSDCNIWCSHSSADDDSSHTECYIMSTDKQLAYFWKYQ